MAIRARVGKKKIIFECELDEHLFYEKYFEKEITIEPQKKRRSLSQNSYYWVYIQIIAADTGNDKNDLHELFKQKFLPDIVVKIKGKKETHEISRKKSTTELTKMEFGEYLERICAFTEIPLPNPEDVGYISNL